MTIIAVSDLHLAAYPRNDAKFAGKTQQDDAQFVAFLDYLDQNLADKDTLVILGDAIDYWRRGLGPALLDSKDALDKLSVIKANKNFNLYYIVGNHDYYNIHLTGVLSKYLHFTEMVMTKRLKEDDQWFLFLHGHQIEVMNNPYPNFGNELHTYDQLSELLSLAGQYTGGTLSSIWDVWTKSGGLLLKDCEVLANKLMPSGSRMPLYLGKSVGFSEALTAMNSMMKSPDERLSGPHNAADGIRKILQSPEKLHDLSLEKGDFLVFGHTHIPFKSDSVMNIGSWNKDYCTAYAFLEIDEGKPVLKRFHDGEVKDMELKNGEYVGLGGHSGEEGREAGEGIGWTNQTG